MASPLTQCFFLVLGATMDFMSFNEITVDAIINAKIKWRRNCECGEIRAVTSFNPGYGTIYQGSNVPMLYFPEFYKTERNCNYIPERRYLTLKQIEKYDGEPYGQPVDIKYVGSKGVRYYKVFNYSDVQWNGKRPFTQYDIEDINNSNIIMTRFCESEQKIAIGFINPSYVPHEGRIYLPAPEYCTNEIGFLENYFHESIHWTRHHLPKCERDLDYFEEELVACLGSIYLLKELKFTPEKFRMEQLLDYLKSFLAAFDAEEQFEVLENAKKYAKIAALELLDSL